MSIEQTPRIKDNDPIKVQYGAMAQGQMRILKDYMQRYGLNVYSRTTALPNGVVVTCKVCYTSEEITITVPGKTATTTTTLKITITCGPSAAVTYNLTGISYRLVVASGAISTDRIIDRGTWTWGDPWFEKYAYSDDSQLSYSGGNFLKFGAVWKFYKHNTTVDSDGYTSWCEYPATYESTSGSTTTTTTASTTTSTTTTTTTTTTAAPRITGSMHGSRTHYTSTYFGTGGGGFSVGFGFSFNILDYGVSVQNLFSHTVVAEDIYAGSELVVGMVLHFTLIVFDKVASGDGFIVDYGCGWYDWGYYTWDGTYISDVGFLTTLTTSSTFWPPAT
jgi:hypothetical protein